MNDPSEDLKREIAHQLYINRNKPHSDTIYNAQTDWAKAEAIARSPLRRMLLKLNQPLIGSERRLEAVLAWLQQAALLEILALVGNLGLIVAVFTYLGTEKQRRDAEVLNAWQTITSAAGQSGNGGRIRALEFLNASPGANWRRRVTCLWVCTWPAESLNGINLEVEFTSEHTPTREQSLGAYLAGIQLPRARLFQAHLAGSVLLKANLARADLTFADLVGADLRFANLEGAFLNGVNLERASLGDANLTRASLRFANLEEVSLIRGNLAGADLTGVNLETADLREADLTEVVLGNEYSDSEGVNLAQADLRRANLEGADLRGVNLAGANLAGANLKNALLCKTQLPEGLYLEPDRDCP
ncbi:MAG: pentapeptide repeat-containing protein [Cyanobacteria bacterium P01_H01_bin.153]